MGKIKKTVMSAMAVPPPVSTVEDGLKIVSQYGCCVHSNFLNGEQVETLLGRLEEQAQLERDQGVATLGNQSRTGKTWIGGVDSNDEIPCWQGINMLPNKGKEFIDLFKHPIPIAYCNGVFGGVPFHLSSSTGLIVRKGAQPMAVHADQQYIPLKTNSPLLLNFMICLSDFTEEMGATRVIPGSHLWENYPEVVASRECGAENAEKYETLSVNCKAGDLIVFESRVWHQSGESISDNVRYSISTFWCQSWLKPMDNYVQSLHDDVISGLDQETLEIFGFRNDTCGRFDPRYPSDRQATNRTVPFIPELRKNSDRKAVSVSDMSESRVYGGAKSMNVKP